MNQKRVLEVNVDDIGLGGVYSLVRNVILHRPENITMDIASWEKFENPANIKELEQHGCAVYYIGHQGNKLLKQWHCFKNLQQIIRENGYQYVHIHSDVANKMFVAALAAKVCKTQHIILHSHASDVDGSHRKMKRLIHLICQKFLPYLGTDFVSCSDLAAEWMFPGIAPKKIHRVRNGVDLEKFRYNPITRETCRRQLKINDTTLLIGHVGRFAYQKNHAYLVQIFSALLKERPDSKLLLVGEGPLQQEIKSLCQTENLGENVIFYGTSTHVDTLLQAMDVFVLPSHFEGLPIVGVEAQAAGLPVIFSDEITKEAALIQHVSFFPIREDTVRDWVDTILKYASIKKKDTMQELKNCGFSMDNTVSDFLALYDR